MNDILVVGVGNSDRGDDALGLAVARTLRPAAPAGVRVIEQRGDAADLVDRLAGTRTAVLVDAAVSGAAPGSFRRIDLQHESLPAAWFACSTHGLGLTAAIGLAQALGSLPPQCIVYAVEGADFAPGAALSACASATIPRVVDSILRDIAQFRATLAANETTGSHP